jgi:hypothetical protein
MISPFYEGDTFIMYLEPILNPYLQSYQNIITLDRIPKGPLEDMVSTLNLPKLSPFLEAGVFSNPNIGRSLLGSCAYVLLRYPKTACNNGAINWKCPDIFMGADDIPALFGYLKKNGYTVDTDITKMMFKGPVTIGGPSQSRFSGDRKMICMVTKN